MEKQTDASRKDADSHSGADNNMEDEDHNVDDEDNEDVAPLALTGSSEKIASIKCTKCGKKMARRGCTQTACLTCCSDTQCATHNETRENHLWKEQVLAGTTDTQKRAKEIRGKAIPPGRFKESNFSYMGDSVVLWDMQQYFSNDPWREDALRKSNKRKTRQFNHDCSSGRSAPSAAAASGKKRRRQRFHDTMETLYLKSLKPA